MLIRLVYVFSFFYIQNAFAVLDVAQVESHDMQSKKRKTDSSSLEFKEFPFETLPENIQRLILLKFKSKAVGIAPQVAKKWNLFFKNNEELRNSNYKIQKEIYLEEIRLKKSLSSQSEIYFFDAIGSGDIDEVYWLMDERSFDLNNLFNEEKQSPLALACLKGHDQIVKKLLQAGSQVDFLSLYFTSAEGHDEILKLLLKSNIDIDQSVQTGPNEGATPLFISTINGKNKVVNLLLNAGASIEKSIPKTIYQKNQYLRFAAALGQYEIVKQLIDTGLKIHHKAQKGAHSGLNALSLAVINQHMSIVDLLLNAGAKIKSSVPKRSMKRNLYIQSAIAMGQKDILDYLESLGVKTQ